MYENSQKIQSNTWWLVFAPKLSAHHFWSFYCCFPLIQLKNACNRSTVPPAQKTCQKWKRTKDDYVFHPNLLHIISVILLLFHINTTQKYNSHKFKWFGTKTPKTYKPTHDDLFLHPNHMHIIFGHFRVVSH